MKKTIFKDRQKALTWWRSLEFSERFKLAEKHFPNSLYALVNSSSSKIETIWTNENKEN